MGQTRKTNMRTFKKSTPDEVKKIIGLYKKGIGVEKIEMIVKKDRGTIYHWLDKLKIKRRGYKKPKRYLSKNPSIKVQEKIHNIIPQDTGKDYRDYLKNEAAKKNSDYVYRLWDKSDLAETVEE